MSTTSNFKASLSYKTPQATNDSASALEDQVGYISIADLMANDLGGAAKQFYGIDQIDPRSASTTAVSSLGALLIVNSGGTISYDPTGALAIRIQELSAGETIDDTFTYTIRLADGTLSTATVTVTVTGMNDAPVLVGASADLSEALNTAGSVTPIATSGTLSFTDSDLRDVGHTAIVAGVAAAGVTSGLPSDPTTVDALLRAFMGPLTVSKASGSSSGTIDWAFAAQDSVFDYLAAGEQATLTYTIEVDDGDGGKDTDTITITITGTNDGPTIVAADDAGAVTEASTTGSLSDTGSITFEDLDLSNTHVVAVGAPVVATSAGVPTGFAPALGFGALTASVAEDATDLDNRGRVDWSFTVDDAAVQGLAAGETVTQTYTLTLTDSSGAPVTQDVTITITGTNDQPVITGGATGLGFLGTLDGDLPLWATGVLDFVDADLSDTHTVGHGLTSAVWSTGGVLPTATSTAIGSAFSASLGQHSTGTGAGTLEWSFSLADSLVEFLAAGETLTLAYDVTVTDKHGLSSTQPVAIVFTGTNDGPTIASGTSVNLSEIAQSTNGVIADPIAASGSLAFADADLSDTHTVGQALTSVVWTGGSTIPSATQAALAAAFSASLSDASTGDGSGSIAWGFSLANPLLDFLAYGETLTLTYDVRVTDNHGVDSTKPVTITISGANDFPIVEAVSGDTNGHAFSEGDSGLTKSGTLTVTDRDLTDTVTASVSQVQVVSGSVNGLSNAQLLSFLTVTPAVLAADEGIANNLTWSFNSGAEAFNYLAAGETLQLHYSIRAVDDSGEANSAGTGIVSISIQGTNDAPVIASAEALGSVVERADDIPDENDGSLTSSGTIAFTDLDLSDTHRVSAVLVSATDSATSSATAARGSFVPTITTAATGGSAGVITWKFAVAAGALDDLAAGQTLTQVYRVTVDDGQGGTAIQDVTVTLSGTNDAPVVTGAIPDLSNEANLTAGAATGVMVVGLYAPGSEVNLLEGKPALTTTSAHHYAHLQQSAATSYLTGYNYMGGHDWFISNGIDAAKLTGGTIVFSDGTTGHIDTASNGANWSTPESAYIYYRAYDPSTALNASVTEIADNAAGEDATTHSQTGAITFSDVDVVDTHSATATAQGSGYLGSFVLGAVDQTGNKVGWTFTVADGALDHLAKGQVVTQSYDVVISDGKGGTATQTVTVTLQGTNDAAVIAAGALDDYAVKEETDLSAGGKLTITDEDTGEAFFQAVTAPITGTNGLYGNFTLAADGTWTYALDNALPAVQALGEGARLTDQITVKSLDNTEHTITVNITGTNDDPVIHAAASTVNGSGLVGVPVFESGMNTPQFTKHGYDTTGNLAAVANGAERAVASSSAHAPLHEAFEVNDGYYGNASSWIPVGSTGWIKIDLKATRSFDTLQFGRDRLGVFDDRDPGSFRIYVAQTDDVYASGNTSNDASEYRLVFDSATVGYDGRVNFGETIRAQFGEVNARYVKVEFDSVPGGSPVAVDEIEIFNTAGNFSVSVGITEIADGAAGENTTTHTRSGVIAFTDADVTDSHSATVTPKGSGYLGTFALDPAGVDQAGKKVGWTFTVADGVLDFLARGQVVTQSYDVVISDGKGGTATETISVTVAGANDAAKIGLPTDPGNDASVTEDESATTLTATGKLSIADPDQNEAFFKTAVLSGAGNLGTLSLAADGTYTYSVSNSAVQYLVGGQTKADEFTVEALDGTTQTVSFTINGVTDAIYQFETGSGSGVQNWAKLGNAYASTTTSSQGSSSLAIEGNGGVGSSSVSAFLGANVGGVNGSAAKIKVHLDAGETFSFDFRFKTGDYLPYDDFSVFVVDETNSVQTLASVSSVGSYTGDTGWIQDKTFAASKSGEYTFGFATMNKVDGGGPPTFLFIDDVKTTGEFVIW